MSFATASLIGAYAKLKGPARQRFVTRHTVVQDPNGRKKPRKITNFTHYLIGSDEIGAESAPLKSDETQNT